MRVLITGVTGYLGGAIAAALIAAGHEVSGTSRNAGRAEGRVPGLAAIHEWAPVDQRLPAAALEGIDAVVHLVGESVAGRWTAAKKARMHDSRIVSTRNLVGAMGAASEGPRLLIGASAIGFYGDRGDDELTEIEPAGGDFLATLTRDWEAEAAKAADSGLRVVHLRTGLVVGRGSPFLKPMLPLFRFGLGGRLGSGNQWWAWVHVDDVTGLVRHAIEHEGVSGPLNVTAPHAARQLDFAKTLGRVLRRPALAPVPAFVLKLVMGEFSGEVLTSKRVRPQAALAAGYGFTYPELEPALRDILRCGR